MNKNAFINLILFSASGFFLAACNSQFSSEAKDKAAGVPCEECSQMTVSAPNIADGVTPTSVDIKIVDSFMTPVANIPMTLDVTDTTGNSTPTACSLSDQDGNSLCRLYTNVAGDKVIQLRGWKTKRKIISFSKPLPLHNLYGIVSGGSYSTASGLIASPNVLKDSHGLTRFRASHLGGFND